MRFAEFLSLAALIVSLTLVGCGDGGGARTDEQLSDYSRDIAKGTAFEKMGSAKEKADE